MRTTIECVKETPEFFRLVAKWWKTTKVYRSSIHYLSSKTNE